MKGKIYLVPFGKQKTTEFLLSKAIELISGNNFSEILYIGPTPRKIRDAQITFTKLVNLKSFIPPKFYTLKQFASEIFQEFSTNQRVLPDFIRPLLIKKLEPEITIGYAKAIADFISEVKQYHPGVSIEDLKNRIRQELLLKNLVSDNGLPKNNNGNDPYTDEVAKQIFTAISILEKYNQLLQKNKWVDSEDILSSAISLISNIPSVNILLLDGFFYDLTRLEEKLVCELIHKAENVLALSFYDSRTPEAYALPQEFLIFLRSLNTLQEEKLPELPEIRTDQPYFVFASIEEEVETIAGLIKKQFFEKKLSLNKTIVTFSRLRDYESLVRRTFTKYNIPHSIYLTKPLSKTQPVIAVLELLRAIINAYPFNSVVAVISSSFFQRFSSLTKEWIGHYAKLAGIVKDKRDWLNFHSRTLYVIKDEHEITEPEKQLIVHIQKDINTFLSLTSKFKQTQNSLSGYTQSLKQLLAQLQWCQGPKNENQQTIKIKNEFYRVLDYIENFELDFGKMEFTEDEFLHILEYLLNHYQLLPEVEIKGVAVLEFLETRGLDCDFLFFGGLSEDKFPGEVKYDPVLPLWLKQKLNLPGFERHLARAKFHYFRLVNTARMQTFLSYYNTDAERLLLPSPFLGNNQSNFKPFNIIFNHEQYVRFQGAIEKIDLTEFVSPVNFSQDPEIKELLFQKFGPTNRLSVTLLEKYSRCPYRFYLEDVLKLSLLEEPRYEIEAKLWGNISHKVMARLYEKHFIPMDILEQEIQNVLNVVLQEEKLPGFWTEVYRRIFNTILPEIIKIEKQMREQGFQPLQIEKNYSARVDDITLSARIDRIDGKKDVLNGTTEQIKIIDYKTGKTTNISPYQITKGIHLQLPLYAYILKKNKPNFKIVDVGIYSLADGVVYWLVSKDNSRSQTIDLNQAVECALNHTRKIVKQIREGIFDIRPLYVSDCNTCDYSAICPLNTTEDISNFSQEMPEESN